MQSRFMAIGPVCFNVEKLESLAFGPAPLNEGAEPTSGENFALFIAFGNHQKVITGTKGEITKAYAGIVAILCPDDMSDDDPGLEMEDPSA